MTSSSLWENWSLDAFWNHFPIIYCLSSHSLIHVPDPKDHFIGKHCTWVVDKSAISLRICDKKSSNGLYRGDLKYRDLFCVFFFFGSARDNFFLNIISSFWFVKKQWSVIMEFRQPRKIEELSDGTLFSDVPNLKLVTRRGMWMKNHKVRKSMNTWAIKWYFAICAKEYENYDKFQLVQPSYTQQIASVLRMIKWKHTLQYTRDP